MQHINLSGYPGAGKTTIFELFLEKYPETLVVPKVTTRPRRPNEGDLEYLFLTDDEFKQKEMFGQIVGVEKIIQKEIPYYYGIPTQELWPKISSKTRLVLSLFGEHAPDIRDEFFPDMKLFFLSLRDKVLLEKRLRERCELDGSDFQSRKILLDQYLTSNIEARYDHVVFNDTTPDKCLDQIFSFL